MHLYPLSNLRFSTFSLPCSTFAGSGDAQTLCITDDDNVWAWGDGDYGKLGRGGSDGCKVPMKIESLAGLGNISTLKLNKEGNES